MKVRTAGPPGATFGCDACKKERGTSGDLPPGVVALVFDERIVHLCQRHTLQLIEALKRAFETGAKRMRDEARNRGVR